MNKIELNLVNTMMISFISASRIQIRFMKRVRVADNQQKSWDNSHKKNYIKKIKICDCNRKDLAGNYILPNEWGEEKSGPGRVGRKKEEDRGKKREKWREKNDTKVELVQRKDLNSCRLRKCSGHLVNIFHNRS